MEMLRDQGNEFRIGLPIHGGRLHVRKPCAIASLLECRHPGIGFDLDLDDLHRIADQDRAMKRGGTANTVSNKS